VLSWNVENILGPAQLIPEIRQTLTAGDNRPI
jgi:hypothetical protein